MWLGDDGSAAREGSGPKQRERERTSAIGHVTPSAACPRRPLSATPISRLAHRRPRQHRAAILHDTYRRVCLFVTQYRWCARSSVLPVSPGPSHPVHWQPPARSVRSEAWSCRLTYPTRIRSPVQDTARTLLTYTPKSPLSSLVACESIYSTSTITCYVGGPMPFALPVFRSQSRI